MTLFTGETMRIECEITDPRSGSIIDMGSQTVTVSLWAPGHPPTEPPTQAELPMRAEGTLWVRDIDTTGMADGAWTYRVTSVRTGGGRSFEYAAFRLYPIPTTANFGV